MEAYIIENWWKHLGCYDREQASNIAYYGQDEDYLAKTDNWWDNLSSTQKEEAYEEFFDEC